MKKIYATNGRVLLKKYEFPRPDTDIILPDSALMKQHFYEILSCPNSLELAKGDIVVIDPYKSFPVHVDEDTFYVVNVEDIICVIRHEK